MSETIATISEEDVEWSYFSDKEGKEKIVFEDSMALAVLLAKEIVLINSYWWRKDLPESDRKNVGVFVICNDIFAWGCADAEDLPHEEIETLYKMWRKDPCWGPAIWCIKQRKQMPQKPVEEDIRKAGIWNLDEMGLNSNTMDQELQDVMVELSQQRKQK